MPEKARSGLIVSLGGMPCWLAVGSGDGREHSPDRGRWEGGIARFWITGILGLALGLSPIVLGSADLRSALWSSAVLGVAARGVSIAGLAVKGKSRQWVYRVITLDGLAALVAPFVFNNNTVVDTRDGETPSAILLFRGEAFPDTFIMRSRARHGPPDHCAAVASHIPSPCYS